MHLNLELESLRLLPAEALVGAEVAVLGSLEVDGLGKVELLDNNTGTHVEVVADDLDKFIGVLLGGAVGVDVDGKRLSDTDGIRKLNKSAASKASSNERLGDPAAEVGSGTIDLRKVLAREGTTTVSTPATVRVDDDLAASETGITLGTTDDEETGGLDLDILLAPEFQEREKVLPNLRGKRSCHPGT